MRTVRARCIALGAALLACIASGTTARAVDVVVFDEANYGGPIGGFYSGLYGGPPNTTAAYVSEVSNATLAGAKLLWAVPADAFTTEEIGAMDAFLAGGGRIGFLGVWYGFAPARNDAINAAVAAFGGHVAIGTTYADNGYPHYAQRADGRIADDPFTAGVNSFVYGVFSPLALENPATALVFGEDGASVLLAWEPIGDGALFVLSSQSAWDLDPYSAGTDNRTLFTNILTAPEPSALLAGVAACLGLVCARRPGRSRRERHRVRA